MLNIEKFYNELRELKVMPLCFSMIDGGLKPAPDNVLVVSLIKVNLTVLKTAKNGCF